MAGDLGVRVNMVRDFGAKVSTVVGYLGARVSTVAGDLGVRVNMVRVFGAKVSTVADDHRARVSKVAAQQPW